MLRANLGNNPYVDGYDPSKPIKYILYFDANNLYGWAMCQFLPCEDFLWLPDEAFEGIAEDPERFVEWLKERYGDDKGKAAMWSVISMHHQQSMIRLPITLLLL